MAISKIYVYDSNAEERAGWLRLKTPDYASRLVQCAYRCFVLIDGVAFTILVAHSLFLAGWAVHNSVFLPHVVQ